MADSNRAGKIFGIGLNKTATSTLHKALTELGISSCHHLHDGQRGRHLIEQALASQEPALSRFPNYQAYSDMQLYRYLQCLDEQYPGSKFIFTTRDRAAWVSSRIKHDTRWNEREAGGLRATDEASCESLKAEYDDVHSLVRRYFKGRESDLLWVDFTAGAAWPELCNFLASPIPDKDFPHENAAQYFGPVQVFKRRIKGQLKQLLWGRD